MAAGRFLFRPNEEPAFRTEAAHQLCDERSGEIRFSPKISLPDTTTLLPLPLPLPAFCLSFRSEAEESAVVVALAVARSFCHPERSEEPRAS
jgi:hypothetical protein